MSDIKLYNEDCLKVMGRVADKLEKDDAKVYRVPSPNGKAIIRIDVKE